MSPAAPPHAVRAPRRKPPPARKSRGGFTLLEIIIALFVASLFLGMAVPPVFNLIRQEKLRTTTRYIESFAKTARAIAMEQARPYEIVFRKNRVILRPHGSDFGEDEDRRSSSAAPPAPRTSLFDDSDVPAAQSAEDVSRVEIIPTDLVLEPAVWTGDGWSEDRTLPWLFQPNGLCDPFQISFLRDTSWVKLTFSPLTASVKDEEYYFP